MKLSTKLLTGLLASLLVMMLISAFSLKAEFEKINQKDAYWDFEKLSEKSFKHLKVIGQKNALGNVNIMEDKNFAVNVVKNRVEEVKVSFENDTLVIRFLKNPSKNDRIQYYQYERFVTILCPEISSIKGETTMIRLDSLNQDKLFIKANKNMRIDVFRIQIPSLNIQLGKFSNCEFRHNRIYNLENLEANVASEASLQMGNVYPKNFKLTTTEKSVIQMNGTAIKIMKK